MKKHLLGHIPLSYESFINLDELFKLFHEETFQALSFRKRFKKVNKTLLNAIFQEKEPCFLLPAIFEFIDRVNREKLLAEPYRFISFEFWLNHFSGISIEENLRIRAKIVGKSVPREEYQIFFPIGMGKMFHGTHFVAAHISPDIDTTIASFWGWVDAFAAKVGDGVHQWSLPGSFTDSHVTILFQQLFSKGVFELLARPSSALTLTALDLVTEKGFVKIHAETKVWNLDHTHTGRAILLIDNHGHFKGDWRSSDAEAIRQIVLLFSSYIRWFENSIHALLINLFAKKDIFLHDITKALETISQMTLKQSDPAREFTEKQKKYQNDYLKKIILLSKGLNSSFLELTAALDHLTNSQFLLFRENLESLVDPLLFDEQERLIEDRPTIFSRLEKIISSLDSAIQAVRNYTDRLDIMIEVKDKVLGIPSQYITLKSDVEEIRTKMDGLEYLTVVIPEEEGKAFPVGIVQAMDLRKPLLGTVSLRDFSNAEETKMASYLEVISVIDHHKSDIKTTSIPTMLIGDTQSSNTIIAQASCQINEKYSTLGLSRETIESQLTSLLKEIRDKSHLQQLKRLLELKLNTEKPSQYYIHPKREFIEYLCFINAILDDTDLLTKVTARDVECVASLLNKMKSIVCGEDIEIISLNDIPKDQAYAKNAAKRILQNSDMYSLYKKIYEFKEQEVEAHLAACIARKPSSVFSDTKEQNGCCRIGQTKIFQANYPLFNTHAQEIRQMWHENALQAFQTNTSIDLHLHMISTIASAEEVHAGIIGNYAHQDEIWFWIPHTSQSIEHLVNFLTGFQTLAAVQQHPMDVEFTGTNAEELEQIFTQNFPKATRKVAKDARQKLPMAILRFKAGLVNSRKAMISPYLPRYIP